MSRRKRKRMKKRGREREEKRKEPLPPQGMEKSKKGDRKNGVTQVETDRR